MNCERMSRTDDVAMLDALLADDVELTQNERDAFRDMRDRLDDGQRELTKPQRRWASDVAAHLGADGLTPAERNANVPRGREVAAPSVLSRDSLQRALDARRRTGVCTGS